MAEEVASGAGTSTSSASTWPIRPADETKADVRAALKRMVTNSYLETSGRGRTSFKTPSVRDGKRQQQQRQHDGGEEDLGGGRVLESLAYNLKLPAIVKGGLFSLVR